MKLLTGLLFALCASCALAQAPAADINFDDDGGQVQVVPAHRPAVTVAATYHRGDVIQKPRQFTIFLGAEWGQSVLREREPRLANLLAAFADSPKHASAPRYQGTHEEFVAAEKPLNDLDIQRQLETLVKNNAIPTPDAKTIIVVYLAPQLKSTLGPAVAGEDYVAYHNFFNALDHEFRYVVVPFDGDTDTLLKNAREAFVEAANNPNGHGWY